MAFRAYFLASNPIEFEMRKWLRRKKKWENDTCEVSSDKTPSLAPVLRLCSGIAHVNVYGLHVEHWLVTTAVGNSSSINRICFQVVLCKTITCEFHVSHVQIQWTEVKSLLYTNVACSNKHSLVHGHTDTFKYWKYCKNRWNNKNTYP